jgi:amidohydrolase
MNIKNEIKQISAEILNQVIDFRRHIHKHPELSFNEFKTAAYIRKILDVNNIEHDDSFGDNAVIGIIHGKQKGITIALRADTDALKIHEKNETDYTSVNKGVMHACGHDVHTASLLGTAIVLNKLKDFIKGKIILVFQPAEEIDPGGAIILINQGLLEKYEIKKIIGQHVLPGMKTGTFGFTPGKSMAATNEIYIKFTGKGGHAAMPDLRSDVVLALGGFINKAEALPEKYKQPEAPVIVAFGRLQAGGAINIIPSESKIEGTMRTFDENVRILLKKEIQQIANECAKKYKCEVEVEIKDGYPHLFNNIDLTQFLIAEAADFFTADQIIEAEMRMTGEDFAYFAQRIPACYYRFGIEGNGKGNVNLHNEFFDVDESALESSVALMSWLALKLQ